MNEVTARVVAGGVVMMSLAVVFAGQTWVLIPLAYGFLARVAAGPRFSPLGQLATRFIVPALPIAARPVPGPPKRFAQSIGAVLSVSAVIAHFAFGTTTIVVVLVTLIAAAASLEAVLGFCLGCTIFSALMHAGVVPSDVCEACADSTRRPAESATQPA
ncbi:DUF4395 domain-containing protein [soil metagenome]